MKALFYLWSLHYIQNSEDINISHNLRKFSPRTHLTTISISCAKTLSRFKSSRKIHFLFMYYRRSAAQSHCTRSAMSVLREQPTILVRIQVPKRKTSISSMSLTCTIRKKLSLLANYHRYYSHEPFCTSPLAPD